MADAENIIMIKDNELKNFTAKLRESNKESKAINDNYTKMMNIHGPRLEKALDNVKGIVNELTMIKQDVDLLPDMFRKEKKVNENYLSIIEDAKSQRDDAVGQKDGLLKSKEDLQLEVKRKIRLAMVTQAARDNMQQSLKEANKTIAAQQNEINQLLAAMDNNETEKGEYRNRHDEMYS